jgi:hypothetical protein
MNNPPPLPPSFGDKRHARQEKTRLPDDFEPFPYSVLIGRGKTCAEATGNKRLKVIASTFLDEYSQAAESRIDKSIIVSKIVDMIRDATPQGAFVKQEDGIWWEVSDHVARERVGSMLRDMLHEQYRSSSKSKLAKRKIQSFEGVDLQKKSSSKRSASPTREKKQPSLFASKVSSSPAADSLVACMDDVSSSSTQPERPTRDRMDTADTANLFCESTVHTPFAHALRLSSDDRAFARLNVEEILQRNQLSTGLESFPVINHFSIDSMQQSVHYGGRVIAQQHNQLDMFAEQQQMLELQLQQNQQEQLYLRRRHVEQQHMNSVPSLDLESPGMLRRIDHQPSDNFERNDEATEPRNWNECNS